MVITALPEATVHLLGSTQVITTPTSLIKELIDNSLDARATSVDIIISSNTLDKLEVRDNGHGVPKDDLNALGKRGHTSKLRSFEELKFLGGVTLGFRGSALASAIQLGDVSITTRTDGESVAVKVRLKAPGYIEEESRTSHPVGTTVSVSNFMARVPVRKKTFEKDAAKTLVKINHLLKAYALARPSIKFSFKVMKGGKSSWSYVPRQNGDIRAAVAQVIGREAANQCIEKSLAFPDSQCRDDPMVEEDHPTDPSDNEKLQSSQRKCFTVEAFLPGAQADPSKIGNGYYLSIDARPVSYEKGTMKKVVILYKKYIRASLVRASDKVKNPFIRMDIKCPVATYDANVEPAKDDVLFENESVVLECVEKLLRDVYGECRVHLATPLQSLTKKLDDFELLLARKTPSSMSTKDFRTQELRNDASLILPSAQSIHLPAPVPLLDIGQSTIAASEETTDEILIEEHSTTRAYEPITPGSISRHLSHHETNSSWTPYPRQTIRDDHIAALQPVVATVFRPQRLPSQDLEDLSETMIRSDSAANGDRDIISVQANQHDQFMPSCISNPTRNITETLPLSPPATLVSKAVKKSRGLNKPFVSHRNKFEDRATPDDLIQTRLSFTHQPSVMQAGAKRTMKQSDSNPDLAWAMDFEERKEAATRRRREELRSKRLPPAEDPIIPAQAARSSPHKNRYNAAIASLELGQHLARMDASGKEKGLFTTSLSNDDPRAYFMRRQISMAAQSLSSGDPPKPRRAKSARLPMEKIPSGAEVYQLTKVLSTNMSSLERITSYFRKDDEYVCRGTQIRGLVMSSDDMPEVSQRLQEAVIAWVGNDGGKGYEINFIFGNLPGIKVLDTHHGSIADIM